MTLRLPRFRTGLPNEHFGVESAQELEQMAIYALLPYYLKRIVLLDTPALKDKLGHSALWQLKGLMESAARKAIEAYEVGVDPGKGESSLDDLDYKIERLRVGLDNKMESVAQKAHLDTILWVSGLSGRTLSFCASYLVGFREPRLSPPSQARG